MTELEEVLEWAARLASGKEFATMSPIDNRRIQILASAVRKETLSQTTIDETPENMKAYLGDSVYALHDGYAVWLYLDNVYGPHAAICIEPEILTNLNEFTEGVKNGR